MNSLKKFIPILVVLAVVGGAMGQNRQGRGMFGRMSMAPTDLLRRDDVKDELKLNVDQKGKIADALDAANQRRREAMQNSGIQFGPDMSDDDRAKIQKVMEEQSALTAKDINGILTADQQKRLKELFVQQNGNRAAMNSDIAKDLGVTDDQKAKFADLQKKMQQAMMELFRNQDMDQQARMDAMKKNMDIMNEQIGKILTDDQRAKLKAANGAPFTFKDDNGGGR